MRVILSRAAFVLFLLPALATIVLAFSAHHGTQRGGSAFMSIGFICLASAFYDISRGRYTSHVGRLVERSKDPKTFERNVTWLFLLGSGLIVFGLLIFFDDGPNGADYVTTVIPK